MLDLHKLEIFLLAAEKRSITATAEQLNMTQSGVSQHIKDLETALGVRLFSRGRRGIELTDAGMLLKEHAAAILRMVAEAEHAVGDLRQQKHAHLVLGATPGISTYLLPEWIADFSAAYPNIRCDLRTLTTPEILHALDERAIALGLIEGELRESAYQKYEVRVLREIEHYVVVGKQHKWWDKRELSVAELNGCSLVTRQPQSQTRAWLEQVFCQQGVSVRIEMAFDNLESIKRAVISRPWISILPDYVVQQEVNLGLLRIIPVRDTPFKRQMKVLWPRRAPLLPAMRKMIDHLRSRAGG